MADRPREELGGRTPLEAAHTPHMDRIAREGMVGSVRTIPEGFEPGSDVANMSVMGFDPSIYYTGRGPIEAINMGLDVRPGDVVFRMNLVTLKREPVGRRIMADYSCGHIPTEESEPMIRALEAALGNFEYRMYPGRSYRHLMIWAGGTASVVTTPPHDILGEEIGMYLPHGQGAGRTPCPDAPGGGDSPRSPDQQGAPQPGGATGLDTLVLGTGHEACPPGIPGALRSCRRGDQRRPT